MINELVSLPLSSDFDPQQVPYITALCQIYATLTFLRIFFRVTLKAQAPARSSKLSSNDPDQYLNG